MGNYFLAVDIGASSGRHIVGWQEDGEIRTEEVHRFPNGVTEADGHLTWDVDALLGAHRRRHRHHQGAGPGRTALPGMMDLYIDETNLYHRMWLYTKQFDWEKMWAIADNITDEGAIRAKAQDILDTFEIEAGPTHHMAAASGRYIGTILKVAKIFNVPVDIITK